MIADLIAKLHLKPNSLLFNTIPIAKATAIKVKETFSGTKDVVTIVAKSKLNRNNHWCW